MFESILFVLLIFPRIINDLSETYPLQVKREWVYLSAFGFAGLTLFSFVQKSPVQIQFASFADILSLGFSLDVLSGLIATTVMLIGASVMCFSERYLDDDPKRSTFQKHLANTLCLVLCMLNATNLLIFWLAWVGTSYFLHQLLSHFSDRPAAQMAANQKFWISRLGDFFILTASIALFYVYGTLEFSTITTRATQMVLEPGHKGVFYLGAVFLAVGAMTKSAQFPFHYWLPNTMETPTPVSALMHAGILNAGGYLIVRMGALLEQAPMALHLLALIGGFTAFYGSLIMLTQTNVKKSLAYSTISQMGFMMLQCGLGAFSVAVVHIIGHAFYKAYAFLSSGTATDFARLNRYLPKPSNNPKIWVPFVLGLACMSFVFLAGILLNYGPNKPGSVVLLIVLGLAISQTFLVHESKKEASKISFLLIGSYFLLFLIIDRALAGVILTGVAHVTAISYTVYVVVSLLFITLYLMQNNLDRLSRTEFGKKIYVKSLSGGFFGF